MSRVDFEDRARDLLLEVVNHVCTIYMGSVTSWWRTPKRNLAVGGVDRSAHVAGLAVDVVYDGERPPSTMLRFPGVKLIREKDHDHFEVAP